MRRPTRRQFCGGAALAGAGAIGTLACRTKPDQVAPTASSDAASTDTQDGTSDAAALSSPALRTFTAATFATLSAICERVLPKDQDPGAIDLGVPGYIDQAAAAPELASVREMLLKALPAFDREARKRHAGTAFADLRPEQQDEILSAWQHGVDGSQRVFDALVSLTLEGAFGDPKYGGNVGGKGFAMIGGRPDPPLHKMASEPGMAPMPGMGPMPERDGAREP